MGRSAGELIHEIRTHKSRKVMDLAAARMGPTQAEELQKTVTSPEELAALLPSHAVYVAAQNQISVLSEQLPFVVVFFGGGRAVLRHAQLALPGSHYRVGTPRPVPDGLQTPWTDYPVSSQDGMTAGSGIPLLCSRGQ